VYRRRFESFGWTTFKIDGHSIIELIEVFEKCRNVHDTPTVIIAKTFKGKYLDGIENSPDWHGKPIGK
jgi:transketolase